MKNILIFSFLMLFSVATFAQRATVIDPSFMTVPRYADLTAINTAIASPQQGMLVYNIATQSYWFRNSSAWTNLAAAVSGSQWTTSGNDIYSSNSGNVGIGTLTPGGKLEVEQNSSDNAMTIHNFGSGAGILSQTFGTATSIIGIASGSSAGTGVSGSSDDGNGVRGYSYSGNGGSFESNIGYGLDAYSNTFTAIHGVSPNSYGIQGVSTSNTAVQGSSTSGFGVQGLSNSNTALYGFSGTGNGLYTEVNGGTAAAARIVNNNGTGNAIDANNNSASNATARLANNNVSGLALKTTTGNVELDGFTKLGSDATTPRIKMKKITGTTPPAPNDFRAFATGVAASKIISLSALVTNSTFKFIPNTDENGQYYHLRIVDNNVTIFTSTTTRSGSIIDKPFTILITYEE